VGRRRFNHLILEISLAAEQRISRYGLWLQLHELGWNPEALSRQAALSFCDGPLATFLANRGINLRPRAARRLRRAVARFDPSVLTPDERMAGL
jgi:hypothetical protein